jgi:hypothetical protein
MDTTQQRRFTLKDLLFMPIGCFLSLSPVALLGLLAAVVLGGVYVYYFVNVDFFGVGTPAFNDYTISPDFRRVDLPDGAALTITYEKSFDSNFTGLVRHASPIRLGDFPILTHDILVTTGDFANPDQVNTSVFDHHFSWNSPQRSPQGTINLLHTVPFNETVYRQLLDLRSGQSVRIIGREILKIDAYTPDGKSKGWWEDSGCNTLVVTSVEVLPEPTP